MTCLIRSHTPATFSEFCLDIYIVMVTGKLECKGGEGVEAKAGSLLGRLHLISFLHHKKHGSIPLVIFFEHLYLLLFVIKYR